ncbi:MAG: mucoidy inhibitor MuiA family protein [Fulvivirga sp.]
MKYLSVLLLLISNSLLAQDFKQVKLTAPIENVTLFLEGAQVTRTGTVTLSPGKSAIELSQLSPHVDAKSIQVRGSGNYTILSVNHKLNFLSKTKLDAQIDSLNNIANDLRSLIDKKETRISILNEKESILSENRDFNTETRAISLSQLQETLNFYEKQLTMIRAEELKTEQEIKENKQTLSQILKQTEKVANNKELPTSEIIIRVDASASAQASLSVSYLVGNAGWFPKYDIRATSVDQPINLKYKANAYQNTGVDWNNVKLKFSNGNPNQSGVAPELETWKLNFARLTRFQPSQRDVYGYRPGSISGKVTSMEDGSPLPGVNVIIKGTTVGTVTDIQGNYSLTLPNDAKSLVFSFIGLNRQEVNIGNRPTIDVQMSPDVQQLSEVVVSGYSRSKKSYDKRAFEPEAETIITNTVENQTTVEFEIAEPYSIKSNGEALTVELKNYKVPAIYEYYAVPKLDKDAFLIARVSNWDQYNLLEGEANLFFEEAFVGSTILDTKTLEDTLNISLGRDKSIVIGREKVDEFAKRKTLGSNKVDTRVYRILVRSKKNVPINMTLFDQVPVSINSEIEVDITDLSGGILNEKTGEVTWSFIVEPQKQIPLKLGYDVKYPKREKVILD